MFADVEDMQVFQKSQKQDLPGLKLSQQDVT
jgi:hypothetical protein